MNCAEKLRVLLDDSKTTRERLMAVESRLIVSPVYPPIPTRSFDYCAYLEPNVEAPKRYGWGASEEDALEELLELETESADDEAFLDASAHLTDSNVLEDDRIDESESTEGGCDAQRA